MRRYSSKQDSFDVKRKTRIFNGLYLSREYKNEAKTKTNVLILIFSWSYPTSKILPGK